LVLAGLCFGFAALGDDQPQVHVDLREGESLCGQWSVELPPLEGLLQFPLEFDNRPVELRLPLGDGNSNLADGFTERPCLPTVCAYFSYGVSL